jgi:N-acetylmuramoyl-L-alanine amidase
VHAWVPVERVAHHVRGFNPRSIGIELVNRGRFPDWLDSRHQAMDEPYPDAQVDALVALLQRLAADLPALRFVAGHEDLDTDRVQASDDPALQVPRKRDPGPLFPWPRVLAAVPLQRLPV